MIDQSISYDSDGNASIDTYSFGGYTVGNNDHGEALYVVGGVEMTAAQYEQNRHFFKAETKGHKTPTSWEWDAARGVMTKVRR